MLQHKTHTIRIEPLGFDCTKCDALRLDQKRTVSFVLEMYLGGVGWSSVSKIFTPQKWHIF